MKKIFSGCFTVLLLTGFMAGCGHWDGITDTTRPIVVSTIPINNAVGVAINSAITATFNEAMARSTITATTFTVSDGETIVPGTVTYAGVTATFTPESNLALNSPYTATITTGARDLAGNALASDYVWTFTTGTTLALAPTVLFTVPDNNATGVTVNRIITATFSQVMDNATITPTTFTVKRSSDNVSFAATSITMDSTGRTAIFRHTPPLVDNTLYTGTITTGAMNTAGTALATNYVWTFTTGSAGDNTAPLLLSTAPTDNATNVPVTQIITATFNEPMDPSTISAATFTVTGPGDNVVTGDVTYAGFTARFAPRLPLAAGLYTAQIAASDLAGNPWVSGNVPNPWTFTTSDNTVAHLGPAPVDLGATEPYGVLAGTDITLGGGPGSTTGFRVIGDVGISPGSTCIGCDATTVNGTIVSTAVAADAKIALVAAYNDAIGRATNLCTLGSDAMTIGPPPGCSSGTPLGTYFPGLYKSGTTLTIPANGTIILDAQNDPSAVFIFQSASAINTLANSRVVLANLAQAKNVFWVAVSSATIGGTTSTFAGTVIALETITVNTGTAMGGRALARNGAVTVQVNALITEPGPAGP